MHRIVKQFIHTVVLVILLINPSMSQIIKEMVKKENIRTVQMHKKDEPLSPPVLRLNSGEKITLSFDDMEGGTKTYSYKLIHCNAGWKSSQLFESDYISGQFTGEIYTSQNSFNTLIQYTHYELNIPNETMQPNLSGNYILMVYGNYNPQDTVLTRRFRITENVAGISGEVEYVNRMSTDKPNQELNLTLQTGNMRLNDPFSNLKIAIQQNYHNERLFGHINPSSMNGNRISYEMNGELVFRGGNEFRHFNTKTTEYTSEHIKTINFIRNDFHFQLKTDENRTYQTYEIKRDLNGRFRIDSENSDNPATEADYVYVYFTLKDDTPATEGNFYVVGAFNNWKCEPINRLQYHAEKKVYQKRLFLKQGYYDFKYIFKSGGELKPYYISGNHYQTENDYLVFIYHTDYSEGYDRLIGHTLINSSEKVY